MEGSMLRFLAGMLSALLLVAGGFFVWKGRAEREQALPDAPPPALVGTPLPPRSLEEPPAATAKTREEKRFARADRDDNGRIEREEMMGPRRKAFVKLDSNGDGRLAFEEWAVTTGTKFAGADADKSGWLTPAEFETTKPKPPKRRSCAC